MKGENKCSYYGWVVGKNVVRGTKTHHRGYVGIIERTYNECQLHKSNHLYSICTSLHSPTEKCCKDPTKNLISNNTAKPFVDRADQPTGLRLDDCHYEV